MQKIRFANVLAEVCDYSPFVNRILTIKIEDMLKIITGHYGKPKYTRVNSSVGSDSLSFSIRKDLNDIFGLNFHNPDGDDIQHHVVMWAELEFGKGKKHNGKNTLIVHTDVSVPSPPGRYSTEKNPYYVLHPKFEKGHVVEFTQGFSTNDFIANPEALAKTIETAIDTTCQKAKDAWIELHDQQTTRDIDLMEVPDIIKTAFGKHNVPVKCEFENTLTGTTIEVTTEHMEDHVGHMDLRYVADRKEWEFDLARGEFDFISNLFDLTNSSYDRNKKAIKNDKLGELMELIAEQYLVQLKTKLDFEAKLDYYMDRWVKND